MHRIFLILYRQNNRMLPFCNPTQFLTLSYRNGIYQGYFNRYNQQRQGYGLVYTTDNNMLMGSTWDRDSCHDATFIYYNHSHYLYGFWHNSIPHGFNALRIGAVLIYAWYDGGAVRGRILIVYEQYNTAIILQQGAGEGQLIQIQKGDIYSDQHLNQYIGICQWPEFQQSWKSLIKFMSGYLINEKVPKPERTKLLLLNQMYFRYGFDEGIAIVFDDEYNILSMGLHQKANLKSLGIRFTKENFIEEGNFNTDKEVFAFNYGQRPEHKIGKLYSNYLLKSVEFVSQFLSNPGKHLFGYWEEVIKSNLFRKLLAGQITTRKLDLSYQSPQKKLVPNHRKQEPPTLKQYAANKKQEDFRQLQQQKMRLQAYKKQIYDSINKKSKVVGDQLIQATQPILRGKRQPILKIDENKKVSQIINKQPVDIATRASRKKQILDNTRSKNRSPIFTPEKSQHRSIQNLTTSPFKEKMRSKIFPQDGQSEDKKQNPPRKYVYQPMQSILYPKHTDANLKNYNSPHQQLDFSRSQGHQNLQVVPLSMRMEMQEEQRRNKATKLKDEKNKSATPTKERRFQLTEQHYKKNSFMQKADPTISFRNPYGQNEIKKQHSNTGTPNIVISSPYKKKSPAHRKVVEIEPEPHQFSKERNKTIQGLNNRKNNIYLNEAKKPADESPNVKSKKQIKGMTYLEKYKYKNPTPEKAQAEFSESRKYNKTIKSFNENNKIYEKVQSPPKFESRNKTQAFEELKQQKQFNQTTPVKKKYQYVFN